MSVDMTDTPKSRILRAEATLLRVPLFALAVRGSASVDGFEFRYARRRGDKTVESVIRTERDEKLPYPGLLSRRVHMGLLSLVSERGFPFENPVTWTWRELCRRMGLPNSGRRDGELKMALRTSWGLKIYGLAALDGRTHETWRRLYSECEFLNEPRADGTIAGANRLWLAPWYLESLNTLHAAPVDYELWKRLEQTGPLASRLYEYLIPTFYKRESLELAYDRLATAMPVVAESRRSHAIRQFSAALKALKAEHVLSEASWDAMKGTGRPKLLLLRGALLARGEEPTKVEGSAAAEAANREATEAAPRLAAEFYQFLGKEVRPLRSDLIVARDLIARFGAGPCSELLPAAVRRLKARFRNAETMGALVRYFEEVVCEAEVQKADAERQGHDIAQRNAGQTRRDREEERRRAAWAALSDGERESIRASILIEQPWSKRFPMLLEAACLLRLTPDDADPKDG